MNANLSLIFIIVLLVVSCKSGTTNEFDITEISEKIEKDAGLNVLTNSNSRSEYYNVWKGSCLSLYASKIEEINSGYIKTKGNIKQINKDSIIAFNVFLGTEALKKEIYLNAWKKLDFTGFKNLKAIEINHYNYEGLSILFKKLKDVETLDYVFLNIDSDRTYEDEYLIPETINELPHLKVIRFRLNEEHRFENIVLPQNFHEHISVDKIIVKGCQHNELHSFKKNLSAVLFHRARHNKNKIKQYHPGLYNESTFGKFYSLSNKKGFRNNKRFIQEILSVKSVQELTLEKVFIDSITSKLGALSKLRKLYLNNCFVSYFPKEVNQLTSLESLKINVSKSLSLNKEDYYFKEVRAFQKAFSESKYKDFHQFYYENLNYDTKQKKYLNRLAERYSRWQEKVLDDAVPVFMSKIEMPNEIRYLKKLKTLLFYNVGFKSGRIPEFVDSKKIKNLIVIDDRSLTKFPQFVGDLSNIETLIWRNSHIHSLPENLKKLQGIATLNLDDNHLTHLDHVIAAATNAAYFTYDNNNIPFEKRLQYNNKIYKNKIDHVRNQQIDRLYEDYYVNRKHGIRNMSPYRVKAIAARPKLRIISTMNNNHEYGFGHKTLNEKEAVYLIDECTRLGLDTIQFFIEDRRLRFSKWAHEFTAKSIDTFSSYGGGARFKKGLMHYNSDADKDLDYGKLDYIRKGGAYGQIGLNNLMKAKNLRFLRISNMKNIDSIPECFCELTKLDSVYVYDPIRENDFKIIRDPLFKRFVDDQDYEKYDKKLEGFKESFRDRKLFDYPIKMPDCIKKMKFKQVSYPGTLDRDNNY